MAVPKNPVSTTEGESEESGGEDGVKKVGESVLNEFLFGFAGDD